MGTYEQVFSGGITLGITFWWEIAFLLDSCLCLITEKVITALRISNTFLCRVMDGLKYSHRLKTMVVT